jgi:hypothetical protein
MKKIIFTSFLLLACTGTYCQLHFENIAQAAGIRYFKTEFSIGNGISFVDFNNDGWDDLTIGTPSGKFIDFYENKQGTFERIFPLVSHRDESKQVLWVDFDNDGDKDLFVASLAGANRLYENQGNLEMVDITEAANLPLQDEYTYGAVWADYNRDGWLDLYFGNHKDTRYDKYNKLFRNNGDGTFTDVSAESRSNDLNKVPFCSAFFDFNNDNWPDIYTANDKLSYNTLLLNLGNGRFSDIGDLVNADQKMNAMCVNVGDYDNDGWQDIYITNTPIGNRLLRNQGIIIEGELPIFEEVAEQAGVGYFGNGWGSNFLDADNDGDLDLYVSGSAKIKSQQNRTSLFYENLGNGTFSIPEIGMGADSATSYVNAVGDINNDGFPDLAVQNNPPYYHHLWKNGGNTNNWLKINLEGKISNQDAVGAKVELFTNGTYQQRYRQCGSGFMGQNSTSLLFGLKDQEVVDSLVITWPTGHIDHFNALAANQVLHFIEGESSNGNILVDTDLNILVSSTSTIKPASLSIYPNPAVDYLWINQEFIGPFDYQLFSLKGELIQSKQRNYKPEVKVTNLPTGQYLLVIQDQNKATYSAYFYKK